MQKIFEEYVESADYKIIVFFKELKSQIEKWFVDGSLAAQGCFLDGDIEISVYSPMEKFLIFNFIENVSDNSDLEEDVDVFKYRVTFTIRLDEMKNSSPNTSQEENSKAKNLEIDNILLKIHQFDDDMSEKGELVEEIKIEDIKEDFIIDKIGQLKYKSDDESSDNNDLKDDFYIK